MKYHLLHLGCQMNQSDSERIETVLKSMDFVPTDRETEADILGIVACSVRQKAIDKVYNLIEKWNHWKKNKQLLTFVSGCILPADREKFLKRFDLLFDLAELDKVPHMIAQYGVATPFSIAASQGIAEVPTEANGAPTEGKKQLITALGGQGPATRPGLKPLKLYDDGAGAKKLSAEAKPIGGAGPAPEKMGGFWDIAPSYSSSFEAYIPIQNGCDKFCTFCAVPYTRGREVSRPSQEIFAEVERLIGLGYKSITLLGQNVNSYGLDKKGSERSFAQLLAGVAQIIEKAKAPAWVYFTSPHPRDMTEDVLHTIAHYPCLAKQIHLPIQSGDDKLLFKMNRNHSMDRYRSIVENIRSILPTATLFTDIIVGFTGETLEQFANTRAAMEEFHYNMAYIAMYSPRPGAASSKWADDVDLEEKKRRYAELTEVLQRHSLEFNEKLVGTELYALVEKKDRKAGYLSGKSEGKIVLRFASDDENLIGQFVKLRITSARPLSIEGELVAVEAPPMGENWNEEQ